MIRVILARNDVLTLFDLRGHITLFFIDLKNNPKHDVGNISSFNHHELTVSYNFVAVIRPTQVKSSCSNVSTRLKFELINFGRNLTGFTCSRLAKNSDPK